MHKHLTCRFKIHLNNNLKTLASGLLTHLKTKSVKQTRFDSQNKNNCTDVATYICMTQHGTVQLKSEWVTTEERHIDSIKAKQKRWGQKTI